MESTKYICTDPSHAPIYQVSGQQTLFAHVSAAVVTLEQDGLSQEELVRRVSSDVLQMLNRSSRNWCDGIGVQKLQHGVVSSWGDVFLKIDGLGFLAGWFINECAQERNAGDLHQALCHLAFESNRNLFATISQIRSALANEAFVYLRILHETLVKSRFLKKYTGNDPNLPGRFLYHTNAAYKKFYERFAEVYGENAAKRMWVETEEYYQDKIQSDAKGDYAWAYPLVEDEYRKTKKRPTFSDLRKAVNDDSTFAKFYYDVATEKTHGRFIWNPLMVRPDAREFRFDPFSTENTGLVINLMLPMYEEVIENTTSS